MSMVPMKSLFFVAHGYGLVALWGMNTGADGASGSTAFEYLCLEEGLSLCLKASTMRTATVRATSNLAQMVPIYQQWNIITSTCLFLTYFHSLSTENTFILLII